MRKSKRHESLIPLSREHHYALMLCLRINRGLLTRADDIEWLESKARQSVRFFEEGLILHFKAEEDTLFPTMRITRAAETLVQELLLEHREIERLIDQLRSPRRDSVARHLEEFVGLLKGHVRKEERVLFPIYEESVSVQLSDKVGSEIKQLIGTALKPNHPELLEP